ncbi:hypothetical protein AYI69_g3946 [Smittium culicis]|uniref:Uncharacterized protein n=1 Tax=Smittium culicis TaxID=133412 RepID=A0A1R1YIB0_9FUNG|nr:hypothetical protein AYI69_g3946 [Smittium culicis]
MLETFADSTCKKFRIIGLDKYFVLEKIEIRPLNTLIPFQITNLTNENLSLKLDSSHNDVVLIQELNPNWNILSHAEKVNYISTRKLKPSFFHNYPIDVFNSLNEKLNNSTDSTSKPPSSMHLATLFDSKSSTEVVQNLKLELPPVAISAATKPQRRFMQMFNEGPFLNQIDLLPNQSKPLFLSLNTSSASVSKNNFIAIQKNRENISNDPLSPNKSYELSKSSSHNTSVSENGLDKQKTNQISFSSSSSSSFSKLSSDNNYVLPVTLRISEVPKPCENESAICEFTLLNSAFTELKFIIESGFRKLILFYDSPHLNFFNCSPYSSYYIDISFKNDSTIPLEWNAFLSDLKLSNENDSNFLSSRNSSSLPSSIGNQNSNQYPTSAITESLNKIPYIKLIGLNGIEKSFGTLNPYETDTIRVVYTTQNEDQFKCKLTLEDLDNRSDKFEWAVYGKMKSILSSRRLELIGDKVIDFGTCASGSWAKKHLIFKNNSDQNLSVSFKIEGDIADLEFQSIDENADDPNLFPDHEFTSSNFQNIESTDQAFASEIQPVNNSLSKYIINSRSEPEGAFSINNNDKLYASTEYKHQNVDSPNFDKSQFLPNEPHLIAENSLTNKKLSHFFNQNNKFNQPFITDIATKPISLAPSDSSIPNTDSSLQAGNSQHNYPFLKNFPLDNLHDSSSAFASNSHSSIPNKSSLFLRNSSNIDSEEKANASDSIILRSRDENNRKKSDELILKPGSTKGIIIMVLESIKGSIPNQELGNVSKHSFTLECKYGNPTDNTSVINASNLSIPCIISCCTSLIAVKQKIIDTGPISVGAVKNLYITVENLADIEAQFRCSLDSKIINCNHLPVKIPPRDSVSIRIDIYPRRINPRYRKQINIVNLKNRNQPDLIVNIKSEHVDPGRMSFHNLLYKTTLNNREQNFIDFGISPINSPVLKIMNIKNLCDEEIEIEFSSENTQSLSVFSLCGDSGADLQIPFNCKFDENDSDSNDHSFNISPIDQSPVNLNEISLNYSVITSALKFMDLLKEANIHGIREKFKELVSESKINTNSNNSDLDSADDVFSKNNTFNSDDIYNSKKSISDTLNFINQPLSSEYIHRIDLKPRSNSLLRNASNFSSITSPDLNLASKSITSTKQPKKRLSLDNKLNSVSSESSKSLLSRYTNNSSSEYKNEISLFVKELSEIIKNDKTMPQRNRHISTNSINTNFNQGLGHNTSNFNHINLKSTYDRLFNNKRHSTLVSSSFEIRALINSLKFQLSSSYFGDTITDKRISRKMFTSKLEDIKQSLQSLSIDSKNTFPKFITNKRVDQANKQSFQCKDSVVASPNKPSNFNGVSQPRDIISSTVAESFKLSRSNSFFDLIKQASKSDNESQKNDHDIIDCLESFSKNKSFQAFSQAIDILQIVIDELGNYPKVPFVSSKDEDAFVRRQLDLRKYLEMLKKSNLLKPLGKLSLNPNSARPIFLIFNASRQLLPDNEKGPKRFDTSLYIKITKYPKSKLKSSPFQSFGMESQPDSFSELPLCRYFVQASICSSKLDIKQKSINIGTIQQNESAKKFLLIRNPNYIPLLYAIKKTGSISSGDISFRDYRYGIVRAFDEKKVEFYFKPTLAGNYNEKIFVTNVVDFEQSQIVILKAVVLKTFNFHINELVLDYGTITMNSNSVNLPIKYLAIRNTSTVARTFIVNINESDTKPIIQSDSSLVLDSMKENFDNAPQPISLTSTNKNNISGFVNNFSPNIYTESNEPSKKQANINSSAFGLDIPRNSHLNSQISDTITTISPKDFESSPPNNSKIDDFDSPCPKKLSTSFLPQDYLGNNIQGFGVDISGNINEATQKSIFDGSDPNQNVSLLHLSKEDLELIESLEQKIKIAKRKNKPEKVEKYIKKINLLKGKNSMVSDNSNIDINPNSEHDATNSNIKESHSDILDSLLSNVPIITNEHSKNNSESSSTSNNKNAKSNSSQPSSNLVSTYKICADGSITAYILPDSMVTIPVSVTITSPANNFTNSFPPINNTPSLSTNTSIEGYNLKPGINALNTNDGIKAEPNQVDSIIASGIAEPDKITNFNEIENEINKNLVTLTQYISVFENIDIDNVKTVKIVAQA